MNAIHDEKSPAAKLIVAKEKTSWEERQEESMGAKRGSVHKVRVQPRRAHPVLKLLSYGI
jgi:hypothetical protein